VPGTARHAVPPVRRLTPAQGPRRLPPTVTLDLRSRVSLGVAGGLDAATRPHDARGPGRGEEVR